MQSPQAPRPPLNLRGSSRKLSGGADPAFASHTAGDGVAGGGGGGGSTAGGASQSETSSPERGDAGCCSEVPLPARRRSLPRVDSRGRRMVSPTPYGNDTDEEDAAGGAGGGALLSVSRVASSRKVPHAYAGTSLPTHRLGDRE